MALQGSGRAGVSRVPIRGFAKLLGNLPAVIRNRVESAFTDAEDLLNFHNLSNPDQINKRSFSGLLEAPIIVGSRSILGGSVEWERVDDPRIAMYEVQVDTINIFSSPESFNVYEPFFSIENIESVRFIRVRSVTQDGRTGNFSNTVSINPLTTAPRAQTFIFYPEYLDESVQRKHGGLAQKSAGETVLVDQRTYAGSQLVPNDFYTIMVADFFPDEERIDGGMQCWGYISNRMKEFIPNSLTRPWDRIRFNVNGRTRQEHMALLCDDGWREWTTGLGRGADAAEGSYSDLAELVGFQEGGSGGFDVGEADSGPMSFYTRGGYTFAFGPWLEPFENLAKRRGQGPKDPSSATESGAGISWEAIGGGLNNAKVPNPPDQDAAELVRWGASIVLPGVGSLSRTAKFQDYNFSVPLDATIRGIEVWMKRFVSFFPATTAIEDNVVRLLDDTGTAVGQNKADPTFPWIKRDNNTKQAIGYQTFGGEADLWYSTWYPAQINSPNFGVSLVARSIVASSTGSLRHAQIAVTYDEFYSNKRLRLSIDVVPQSNFYLRREVFGACFNVIEFGQKEQAIVLIGDDPC